MDAVFAMEQARHESTPAFIMRLEGMRARYTISPGEMFRHFRTKLSPEEKAKVDALYDQVAFSKGS